MKVSCVLTDAILTCLVGLGQSWLWRSQPYLARIHARESSSSSGGGSGGQSAQGTMQYAQQDEDYDATQTSADVLQRLSTADYVEARGYLLPSTEFFSRAISVAEEIDTVTGDLLASVCMIVRV